MRKDKVLGYLVWLKKRQDKLLLWLSSFQVYFVF